MILFKCVHGHVFSEDEMVREEYPEGEAVRHRYLCPDCGTEDFEQAHACSRCGLLFREDELDFDLCEKCREELDDEVKEFSRRYKGKEREYLFHRFDESEGVFA